APTPVVSVAPVGRTEPTPRITVPSVAAIQVGRAADQVGRGADQVGRGADQTGSGPAVAIPGFDRDTAAEDGAGAARQWQVRAGELDRALAELRSHVGDRPGELEISWRPTL
uniref:hypothetical protein n=1 Tax=Frankia tisae TaxID=2950104 RepID=UPI0021C02515